MRVNIENRVLELLGAPFEIGPRFEDSEKLTRRDLRSLRDKFASSLIGFVLFEPENGFIFVILYNI